MSPLVGICHELALSTALAEWVLRDDALPRSEGSLIEANRWVDFSESGRPIFLPEAEHSGL